MASLLNGQNREPPLVPESPLTSYVTPQGACPLMAVRLLRMGRQARCAVWPQCGLFQQCPLFGESFAMNERNPIARLKLF